MQPDELEYVGFWPRVGTSLIDTIFLGVIIGPILTALYGESYWTSEQFFQRPNGFLAIEESFDIRIVPLLAVIQAHGSKGKSCGGKF